MDKRIDLDVIDEQSDEYRGTAMSQNIPGRKSEDVGLMKRPLLNQNPNSQNENIGTNLKIPKIQKLQSVKSVNSAITTKELEIVRAEMAKEEFTLSHKEKVISWIILMMLLLAQVSNQWQRFLIATAFNYDNDSDDPYYMMSIAIPNFTTSRYGLLSGVLFTSLFSVTVLFSGVLSDNFSRKWILAIAAILWSITSVTTAISKNYAEVAASRMMLGFFEAFCGPPAYSLIVDYFPPEVRTTANAVYAFGIYVGLMLSSTIIVMIKELGWRWTYAITGFVGIGIGVLILIIVKDPVRGRFEPRVDVAQVEDRLTDGSEDDYDLFDNKEKVKQTPPPAQPNLCVKYFGGFKAMFTNNVCFYTVLAASCRYWQGNVIAYYALSFFSDYKMDSLYGVLNGLSVMIGGFSSQIIAAQISDRYEKQIPKIKPYVCIVMSLLGIVTACLCFLFNFNFYFSMFFLFMEYLCSEGWMSPAVAMIQLTIDVRYKGVAMGVFLFATAIVGTIGTLVVGVVIQDFHVSDQKTKGIIIALNTAIPCALAAVLFYVASIHYGRFKQKLEMEKEEANIKASNLDFSDQKSVLSYGQFKQTRSNSNAFSFRQGKEFRVTRNYASSMQVVKRPLITIESTMKKSDGGLTNGSVNNSGSEHKGDKDKSLRNVATSHEVPKVLPMSLQEEKSGLLLDTHDEGKLVLDDPFGDNDI